MILDLAKFLDKSIRVKFQGGREGETPRAHPKSGVGQLLTSKRHPSYQERDLLHPFFYRSTRCSQGI